MSINPSPVAPLTPRYVNDQAAAAYTGRSSSWFRNQRTRDTRRVNDGLEPEGPHWVKLGRQTLYEVAALDRWLEASVERMKMDPPRVAGSARCRRPQQTCSPRKVLGAGREQ